MIGVALPIYIGMDTCLPGGIELAGREQLTKESV